MGTSAPLTPQRQGPRRTYRPILGVVVLSILGILATAGVKSYRDLAKARAHEAELETKIETTQARIEILAEQVGRMESDPVTLERMAREELGMVRPGDVVIVLPDEDDDPEAPGAGPAL